MRIRSDALMPLFARHETFHPRNGWLTKAVDAVDVDPYVFTRDRAPIDLGVGKNMVRAIRYWGIACKVFEETAREGDSRAIPLRVTPMGQLLLGRQGWDRYIEDPRTLWLLHWELLRPPVMAPVWWWAFNQFDAVEFEAADLERFAIEAMIDEGWAGPAVSSVAKDVDCLLRMYGRRSRVGGEEWLDSPFASLELIEPVPGQSRRWRFGSARMLEPAIVAYAALDCLRRWEASAKTVSLARLAAAPGGPGRAFRLTESALAAALGVAAQQVQGLTVAAPAGLTQLIANRDVGVLQLELLARAYGRGPDAVAVTPIAEAAEGHEHAG